MARITNLDSVAHSWGGVYIGASAYYETANDTEDKAFAADATFCTDLSNGLASVSVNGAVLAWNNALTYLAQKIADVYVKATPPFAQPDYRTKRDATTGWISCASNDTQEIDFQLSEERYVTGGEIIFSGTKKGDYITAEVADPGNLIPEAYRSALCESHPTVARYIVKKWIKPTDGFDSFTIDTYPLNAKISAGLVLRVTFHASAAEGTRELAVNYHLTKKL